MPVSYTHLDVYKRQEESYALLTGGEWALTSSASYEFDTQNRWVKRTAGNGRVTQRELCLLYTSRCV